MVTVALTPTMAAAAVAPSMVVEMAEMLAGGSLTTSGVSMSTGGGGAIFALTCPCDASDVSQIMPQVHRCSFDCVNTMFS